MSKYNFDLLAKRKHTNCVKYDEFNSSLPMWVADMDFLMAPKIKEAIQKDLDIAAIGYSLIPDTFFDAFVNLYHKRYETNFEREEMVYVSGVVASIDSMIKLLSKEGDNIVMLSPIYHTFYHCICNYKRVALVSEMKLEDKSYSIDWDDLERKLSNPKSSIMILCNPHNPVGKIFSKEELERIDQLATKHNVLVISDEIHGLIANPGKKYIPYGNVAKGKFVTCLATSKAFNLAGLQSAVVVCKDKDLRDKLVILNIINLIKTSNTLDDEVFKSEDLYLNSLSDFLDFKLSVTIDLRNFCRYLCMYYVALFKSYAKLEISFLDNAEDIPSLYGMIIASLDFFTLGSIFAKADSFDTDECPVIKNAASYIITLVEKTKVANNLLEAILNKKE